MTSDIGLSFVASKFLLFMHVHGFKLLHHCSVRQDVLTARSSGDRRTIDFRDVNKKFLRDFTPGVSPEIYIQLLL